MLRTSAVVGALGSGGGPPGHGRWWLTQAVRSPVRLLRTDRLGHHDVVDELQQAADLELALLLDDGPVGDHHDGRSALPQRPQRLDHAGVRPHGVDVLEEQAVDEAGDVVVEPQTAPQGDGDVGPRGVPVGVEVQQPPGVVVAATGTRHEGPRPLREGRRPVDQRAVEVHQHDHRAESAAGAPRSYGRDVLLAHLSDPHLPAGVLAAGPARALHSALGRAAALDVDAVVITGDLVERATPEAYEVLREVLDDAARSLPVPVLLAVGNHDDPTELLARFGGSAHLGGGRSTHYAHDLPGARLLVLDSAVRGQGAGRLGAPQLAWLAEELAARPDTPALLALHHPPAAVGIPFLDSTGLDDADALAAVVATHPHVVRVLAGHVHRTTTTAFAGTVAVTAPSTWRQSALDLTAPGRMGYLDEPAALLLHQLDERTDGVCVTHVVPVDAASPVFPVPR